MFAHFNWSAVSLWLVWSPQAVMITTVFAAANFIISWLSSFVSHYIVESHLLWYYNHLVYYLTKPPGYMTSILWSLTHSLLRLTSEGRSDLHNERSCADDHSESIVHPWSSSACCIQVFLGRPGGRFQLGAGHLLCERLTQCWRILWAGTSGDRRQTCPMSKHVLSSVGYDEG